MLTYIDYLPIDVIREHIMPHLNYSERFGLNMCIPTIDRIPKRMNKLSIEKHDQIMRIPILKKYLDISFFSTGSTQVKNMAIVMKLLQEPLYFDIVKRSTPFRDTIIRKVPELIRGLIKLKEHIELGLKVSLASELKNLRNKIDVSGPYTDIRYDDIEPLSFQ
jgi:hypothetical protein